MRTCCWCASSWPCWWPASAFLSYRFFEAPILKLKDRFQPGKAAEPIVRPAAPLLWLGHNNWNKDEVKADIASSIAALAPNQAYVILSMLNWAPSGARGTQEYADTVRVNGELAAMYPDNFLDIRQYLVGLYDPNSWQDVQDHQNDLPPSSLRFDGIHLNDAGCVAVASKVQEFLAGKGW